MNKRLLVGLCLLCVGLLTGDTPRVPIPAAPEPAYDPDRTVAVLVAHVLFREEQFDTVRTRLNRAGYRLRVASRDTLIATGFDHTVIRPDAAWEDIDPGEFAGLVLIGGSGAVLHWNDSTLFAVCRAFASEDRIVGAIGLAVPILAWADLLENRRATTFPDRNAVATLTDVGAHYVHSPVVQDGNVITAVDTDQARAFADRLIAALDRKSP